MYYFLEAAGTGEMNPMSGISTLIMLVALIVVFYFFMYRPQKKQEKEANDMRNGLQVGDEITTIGGIIGKIVSIKDETVLIETSNEITREAIDTITVVLVKIFLE